MQNPFVRTEMLIGIEQLNKLKNAHVAVFGVGGVGGYTVEALVRCGIGAISVFDCDTVALSNVNRQIIADFTTIGKSKVEVVCARAKAINPNVDFYCYNTFITPENLGDYDLTNYDYVVDAIDTVASKLAIIQQAQKVNVKVISCMGTGGKTDITKLKVSTIDKTNGCPLARAMRREAKARNLQSFKVVYSDEVAGVLNTQIQETKTDGKKAPPSMIFVPATAGLLLAQQVVNDLTKN